ncbi:MAG: hypothetical protein HY331_01195, partial [Chloroflexi bacterium]|nr:hypothetical protein [Chloroflexota bacterium]
PGLWSLVCGWRARRDPRPLTSTFERPTPDPHALAPDPRLPTADRWGLILAWIAVFLLVYAVRLPAVFHHGRYLFPLIPWLILLGLAGLVVSLRALPLRLLGRVYVVVTVVFWLAMWVNGAVVYGWDSRFIDDEQVAVARWLHANTPPNALVASHDVGAIGYFAGRRLVDTAGLITPELAPYVRDQAYLSAYLERAQVDYLAMFPAWYPRLAGDPAWEVVFRVEETYPLAQGAENMIILRRR